MPASQLNRTRENASVPADQLDTAVDHDRSPVGAWSHKHGVQWPCDQDCGTDSPEVAIRPCLDSRLPAPTSLGGVSRDARPLRSAGGITRHDVTPVRRGRCGEHNPVARCGHPLDLEGEGPNGFGQCGVPGVPGVPRQDISGSSSGNDSICLDPGCHYERLGGPDAARSARSPSR